MPEQGLIAPTCLAIAAAAGEQSPIHQPPRSASSPSLSAIHRSPVALGCQTELEREELSRLLCLGRTRPRRGLELPLLIARLVNTATYSLLGVVNLALSCPPRPSAPAPRWAPYARSFTSWLSTLSLVTHTHTTLAFSCRFFSPRIRDKGDFLTNS